MRTSTERLKDLSAISITYDKTSQFTQVFFCIKCTPKRSPNLSWCEQNRTRVVSKTGHFVVFKTGRAIKTGIIFHILVVGSGVDILTELQWRVRLCGDAT